MSFQLNEQAVTQSHPTNTKVGGLTKLFISLGWAKNPQQAAMAQVVVIVLALAAATVLFMLPGASTDRSTVISPSDVDPITGLPLGDTQ